MDWRPVMIGTAGAGVFTTLALTGAFVIVSLAPPEPPPTLGDKGLLMEGASGLRPFHTLPVHAHEPETRAEPPPPSLPRSEAAPSSAELLTTLKENTSPAPLLQILGPVPAPAKASAPVPAALPVPVPPQFTHREAPRTVAKAEPYALPERSPPAAAMPQIRPKVESRAEGVLSPSAVRRLHLSLRLTREQELYWLPVEQALLEIGSQQAALVRAGQDPKDAFGVGAAMRMYSAARPLLDCLREDQKARVRAQARSMGFASVASQI
jgi:hypothetical protein